MPRIPSAVVCCWAILFVTNQVTNASSNTNNQQPDATFTFVHKRQAQCSGDCPTIVVDQTFPAVLSSTKTTRTTHTGTSDPSSNYDRTRTTEGFDEYFNTLTRSHTRDPTLSSMLNYYSSLAVSGYGGLYSLTGTSFSGSGSGSGSGGTHVFVILSPGAIKGIIAGCVLRVMAIFGAWLIWWRKFKGKKSKGEYKMVEPRSEGPDLNGAEAEQKNEGQVEVEQLPSYGEAITTERHAVPPINDGRPIVRLGGSDRLG